MNRECFCCGASLREDWPDSPSPVEHRNWLGATDWTTHGNWCSTAFDGPMDPEFKRCHIVICDECFKKNKERIYFIPMTDEEKRFEEEQKEKSKEIWREIKDQILKEIKDTKDLGPSV